MCLELLELERFAGIQVVVVVARSGVPQNDARWPPRTRSLCRDFCHIVMNDISPETPAWLRCGLFIVR